MAVFKFFVFMTTPEAKEELGGAGAQAQEAMFRSWVSLLDAGSLGETADGPGSRIITLGWLFFVLVRRGTCADESRIRPTPRCAWQITVNSYIANLASIFSADSVEYFGPRTKAELLHTDVCMPQFLQAELDTYLMNPLLWVEGQQWGKRLLETNAVRVGTIVAPNLPPDARPDLEMRIDECKNMLMNSAAQPQGSKMAIILPMSQARRFLADDNCDQFSLAPALKFSQMERMPHFIMPYGTVVAKGRLIQSWNAVAKYISATEDYRLLAARYLGVDFACSEPPPDGSAVTLRQQSGAPSLLHSSLSPTCAPVLRHACCLCEVCLRIRVVYHHTGRHVHRGDGPLVPATVAGADNCLRARLGCLLEAPIYSSGEGAHEGSEAE
jgi:hypothetical protein